MAATSKVKTSPVPNYEDTIFVNSSQIMTKIDTIYNSPSFTQFMENTKCSGFDPVKIYEAVWNKANGNTEVIASDMTYLIQLFLNRGNNVGRIAQKSSAIGKKLIMEYVKKYGIKSKVQNEGAFAINLGRIAAAFPLMTAKILMIVPDKYMDRPFPYKK